jgi:carbamoyl-phosphate synthase small subunit
VRRALLALADGTVFEGRPIGFEGEAVGEVVFNDDLSAHRQLWSDAGGR